MLFRTSMENISQTSTVLTTRTLPGPNASRARLGRARKADTSGGLAAHAACSRTARSCWYDGRAASSGCASASLGAGGARGGRGDERAVDGQGRRPPAYSNAVWQALVACSLAQWLAK